MRIEISADAEEQLLAIEKRYKEYSLASARKLLRQFHKRLCQLSRFPFMGEKIPELGYPQLRHIFVGPYRVVYHVHPDFIEVIGFLYSAQEWPVN